MELRPYIIVILYKFHPKKLIFKNVLTFLNIFKVKEKESNGVISADVLRGKTGQMTIQTREE